MPRSPRNGFCSAGMGRYGTSLSPPMSSVRMMIGRPLSALVIAAVGGELLVLAGGAVALQEQELGAQQAHALAARLDGVRRLDASLMLATTSMRVPSVMIAGW